jgi:hypothetical protein
MTSFESLKLSLGQYEERFITNTSLKGVYQDIQLYGLSSTTRSSSESEKENVMQYAVRYLEERFLHQGTTERSWQTGSTVEDFGISEI